LIGGLTQGGAADGWRRRGAAPTSATLRANIKFFGRHGGFIRDGVLLGLR
jgi:hypothetical protein